MKRILYTITLLCSVFSLKSQPPSLADYRWNPIETELEAVGRHENTFVEYKDKFYLLGGRGIKPVNIFDPSSNSWDTKGKSPMEIHHFQALVYDDAIYLVGAMTGGYPKEKPLENIWIYYPETDSWEKGPEVPQNRRRGGAGAVLYNNKIYLVGGIKFGHTSGTNNYFDSYDLKTGEWEILTDAPHVRDHFPAIVADNKLFCIGGRNTSVHHPDNFGAFFTATVGEVDYFDFSEGSWYTMKEKLPFETAAGGIVQIDDYLLYMGGEGSLSQAYNHTQCLDINSGKWTQLAPMYTGRHGSGAILHKGKAYIAAGSPNRGGGNMGSIEVFTPDHNWTNLFNGENLDGWNVKCVESDKAKSFWFVKDGAIYCNSLGDKDHDYSWLMHQNEYEDFELRLKFKVSKKTTGNTGVQIRSRYDEEAIIGGEGNEPGWLDGPQIDINPLTSFRNGLIYDETRTEKRWLYPSLPDWKIEKDDLEDKRVIYYWADQKTGWNDMTIRCEGARITTFVNNMPIADFDGSGVLDDKAHKKYKVGMKGFIALQLHKNSENEIWYKDIEVRILE